MKMFRLIRFQNFTDNIHSIGLIKDHLLRQYGQHYDYLTGIILLRNQKYCSSNSNRSGNSISNSSGNGTSSSSGTTTTTATDKDNHKMNAESTYTCALEDNISNTNKTTAPAVIVRRRKYVRNATKNRYRGDVNKSYKTPFRNRFRNPSSSTSISQNTHDSPPQTDTALTISNITTNLHAVHNRNNNNNNDNKSTESLTGKKNKPDVEMSFIKKEVPVKPVHIEYMESHKKNINDLITISNNYNNDSKTQQKETEDINPLKKLENQINDPMLLKLIIRSQLVPDSTKPHKGTSDTMLNQIDKNQNNAGSTDNVKDSKTNLLESIHSESKSKKHVTNNIKKLHEIHKHNTKSNNNMNLADKVDKKNKNKVDIHIILPSQETSINTVMDAYKTESKKKQATQVDPKSPKTENSMKIITKAQKPLAKYFNKTDQDIVTKKIKLRSKTENELSKNIRAKTSKSRYPSRTQNTVNNWYLNKVKKIKQKVKGPVKNAKTGAIGIKKGKTKVIAGVRKNNSKSYNQILATLKGISSPDKDTTIKLEGYKDQATKLAEIMTTNVNNNVLNKPKSTKGQKDKGIGGSSGGGRGSNNNDNIGSGNSQTKRATLHYVKGKPSKVYIYVRNLCYLLMTIIGSYTIYYAAEILSHDEADTMLIASNWPMEDTKLPLDDDNESEQNTEKTDVEPLEIDNKQKRATDSQLGGDEEDDDQAYDDDDVNDYNEFQMYKRHVLYMGEEGF